MEQKPNNVYEEKGPITDALLGRMDAWFRAANYLSAGQLYLLENPLLKKPLTLDMIKKKIVGHWGTVPGQNFVFVHLNRVIKRYDLDLILLSGPGHGGNFYIANDYMDGTYSEVYPNISQDEAGMQKLFKQFSRWRPQSLRPRDAGLDQRRRRVGLRHCPCLWRRVRQSGPDRGGHCRRWRG